MVISKLSQIFIKVAIVIFRLPRSIRLVLGLSESIFNAISLWLKPFAFLNSAIRFPSFSKYISVSVFNMALQMNIKIVIFFLAWGYILLPHFYYL